MREIKNYTDLDDLIWDYEDGEITLEEYISEYNRLVKEKSLRDMAREGIGKKEHI